jgi:hypothetical protein
MSDEFAAVSEAEPTGGSPEFSSEAPSQGNDTPILSVDEYQNYQVPIKIDGQESYIPLGEAISGYQRQADYTRKTQELAQQREQMQFASALQTALERDPAATIDLLTRHYGISRQAATEMANEYGDFGDYEEVDPIEQRYRALDERIAAFEEQQAIAEVEKEISRLRSKYQDFDTNEVVNAALRVGTTDLESVYKQIAFDKIMARQETERAGREQLAAREQQVIESKREASVIAGGSNPTGAGMVQQAEPIRSIRDAWTAAKQELNANF